MRGMRACSSAAGRMACRLDPAWSRPHLIMGALEVVYAESIHADAWHAKLQAIVDHVDHLAVSVLVASDRGELIVAREASVPVHDERDMARDAPEQEEQTQHSAEEGHRHH